MIERDKPESVNYSHARLRAFILLVALLQSASTLAAQLQPPFTEDIEARVLILTNDLRKQQGLQPLQPEARLADAARSFAAYVAKTDKLDHDADGSTPTDRVKKRGYDYCIVAENLGYEYSSAGFTPDRLARNFLQAWNESASHRANIMEPEITQVGVGIAPGAKSGEYYAVQVFGRPMSQMVKFRITNRSNESIRYEYRKRFVALAPRQVRTHESCMSGDLKVDLPGQQQATTVRPKDGAAYTIVESGRGSFRVTEQ